jgi:hypothetical protein
VAGAIGGAEVTAGADVGVDGAEGFEELLRVPGRCAPLAHALAVSDRPVGVLGAVVPPLVPSMLRAWKHLLERGRVAGQRIGDHDPRRLLFAVQHAPQEALGGGLVPTCLAEEVEDQPRPGPPPATASASCR